LIDGRVFAADGGPADGLDVWLEAKATQVRAHTTVGAGGVFRFDDVVDGEYRLWFGAPEVPLVTQVELDFRAPTLRIADRTLPPTGALEIASVDERGLPVGDVEVTGSGTPRGALRVTTGAHGRAEARWLMPGSYRLEARSADGRVARETLKVTAGERRFAVLRMRAP
jgi:hypothetical protein